MSGAQPFQPGDHILVAGHVDSMPTWLANGTMHIVESLDLRPGTTDWYVKLLGSPSTWRAERFILADVDAPAPAPASVQTPDVVNHPPHYRLAHGVEVIDLTEQLDFLRGNAVKYLSRAGHKPGADELEDLKKARWYIERAITKHEKEHA